MPCSVLPSTTAHRLLLGAMLLAAALSSWHGLTRQGLMTWDEGVYFDEARFVSQALAAVRHSSAADIPRYTTGFAPRMARPLNVVLNVTAMTFLGIHQWVPAALAGLVGILCIWATYALGRRVFDERVGLLAALLLVASPYFLQYRRMGLPEAAGTLLALLVLQRLLALRAQDERRPWLNSLGLGLMLGAALTLNMRLGVLLPVAALFRLCWLGGRPEARRVLGHLAAMALGAAAVLAAFELPYRLLPLLITSPPPVESYFQQLARFALTQQDMGRAPLHLSYLAPLVFLLYFDAPALLLGLVAVSSKSPRVWRQPGPALLIVSLLAQLLALGLIASSVRYLSWVLPLLMVLAAYGVTRLADVVAPRARAVAVVGLLLLCLAHASFRAAPILQARGAMAEAAVWLADQRAATVITSDKSIAMGYLHTPVAQLPVEHRAARDLIAGLCTRGRCYVLLDRQQFVHRTFVMTPEEYGQSAPGIIAGFARPQGTARQFRGLFMPFCFEHNRDILQTVRTGRGFARDGETITIYAAEDALRALDRHRPQ